MPGARKNYKKWYKGRYGETPRGTELPANYYNSRWSTVKGYRKGKKGFKKNFPEPGNNWQEMQPVVDGVDYTLPGTDYESNLQDIQIQEKLVSRCRVYNSGDFSHNSSGSWLAVTFDSERWDKEGNHEGVTNPSRITIVTGGLYVITGHASFAANATGMRSIAIRLNGTTYIAMQHIPSVGASLTSVLSVHTIYALAEDDYIELMAYQDSGGTLAIKAAGNYSPELSIVRF